MVRKHDVLIYDKTTTPMTYILYYRTGYKFFLFDFFDIDILSFDIISV